MACSAMSHSLTSHFMISIPRICCKVTVVTASLAPKARFIALS